MEQTDPCAAARGMAWTDDTLPVLRDHLASRCIDLGTALQAFLNGQPLRHNHTPRAEVPEADRAACALLDAICQRVNCGFYLPDPARQMRDCRAFVAWIHTQEADARAGRKGRWCFNPVLVAPMTADYRASAAPRPARLRGTGLFRRHVLPLFGG